MKKTVLALILGILCSIAVFGQSQDKQARKLADKVATAFFLGLSKLDRQSLLHSRLHLTIENSIGEPEFEYKSFRNFTAMERWMKSEENQPGFPVRMSGEKVSCRGGRCRLDLIDGQMMHNHVYLTRIDYGYRKGRIYIKRLRILYG